ncbi:MAG: hypothetical protein J6Y08_06075 [Clostridiales bacterium]|nr:hypothetical protein [Clostridiales bacterium]
MKSYLSKMNRGLVLFFLLVAGVAIYILVDHVENKKKEKAILAITEQYIAESCDSFEFPDTALFFESQATSSEISREKVEPLLHFFSSNDKIIEAAGFANSGYWDYCLSDALCPRACSRQPSNVEVSVYKDSATVTLTTTNVIDFVNESGFSHSRSSTTVETMYFVYKDGQWLLVSVNSSLGMGYIDDYSDSYYY